jgi:hypothetical protein
MGPDRLSGPGASDLAHRPREANPGFAAEAVRREHTGRFVRQLEWLTVRTRAVPRLFAAVDTWAHARDTRIMSALGSSRWRLAEVLNAAFAEGLLSEQTHSYRLGLLFGPRLVDQQRLIGDLTLRRERSLPAQAARDAWAAIVAQLRTANGRCASSAASLLLTLDPIRSESLLLGRHPRCDVVVCNPSVSRRHAQLTFRDGVWVIQDLASTNGTTVNGVRVGRATLRAGDIVTLADQSIQVD